MYAVKLTHVPCPSRNDANSLLKEELEGNHSQAVSNAKLICAVTVLNSTIKRIFQIFMDNKYDFVSLKTCVNNCYF